MLRDEPDITSVLSVVTVRLCICSVPVQNVIEASSSFSAMKTSSAVGLNTGMITLVGSLNVRRASSFFKDGCSNLCTSKVGA